MTLIRSVIEACQKANKDERGIGSIFFVLMLLPLLLLLLMIIFRTSNISSMADDVFQASINEATRAAAMRVDPISNSKGDRRIAYNLAKETFLDELDHTLVMSTDSPIKSVKYWLVVYNGDNKFVDNGEYKLAPYYFCTNANGSLYEEKDMNPMESLSVKVTQEGIRTSTDTMKGKVVELKGPGVVAVVAVEMDNLDKSKTQTVVRWSSHKIDEY